MCRKEDHWHRQRWKVVSCQFLDIANMLTFNVGQRRFHGTETTIHIEAVVGITNISVKVRLENLVVQ